MKKTFFRMLPFVAAAVLAASCGKDGDSDVNISAPEPIATPDPTQTTVGDGFVEIPFSIKVNDGNTLSKVALSYDENKKKTIDFESEDYKTVKLSVEGKTVSGISGTLDLSSKKPYTFSGNITVPNGQESNFTDGKIDLVGTFKLNEGSTTTSSATSFKDLWDNCAHEFKAEFKSNDDKLTLVDQNFYIYVATYKSAIVINGSSVVAEKGFAKGTYYVFPISTLVTDNGSAKSIAPSKLYTIGEYVDLGVEVGGKKILFAKDNTYDAKAWSALSVDELKLLPTKDEWKALSEQCTWTWDDTEGHKGYTVSSTSTGQSVFLPVTPGSSAGFYWSSTENEGNADGAYCLRLRSYRVDPEVNYVKTNTWSVRTVRRSN